MNVDIANMLQKTDWIQHFITALSVFLGAFLAYQLNLRLEMRKAKRQMRGNICALSTQFYLNLDDMLEYKRNILDKVKMAYENKSMEAISMIIRGPMVSFDFNMERYIFLNDCNRCFIPEIKTIQSTFDTLRCLWANYTEQMFSAKPLYMQGNQSIFDDMYKKFLSNYNLYIKLCIRLYYLEKHFRDCYLRFFNIHYFDDKDDENELKIKMDKYIPNALQDNDFIKISDYFDKHWCPEHTLWKDIKYHYRKLKYRLRGLKIYFFGRSKPKSKRKSKGKK